MRWAFKQSSAPKADELLAMDWGSLGLLIQQQAFDAVTLHKSVWPEPHGVESSNKSVTENDR